MHGDEACGVLDDVPYAVKQLGVCEMVVVVEVVVQLQLIHLYPHVGHPFFFKFNLIILNFFILS